jgi:hypothetical protein
MKRSEESRGGLIFGLRTFLGERLWGSSGIFWIEPGGGHDGASEIFGGKGEGFGWRPAIRFFGSIGSDEAVAATDNGLQALRVVGVVGEGAADLADGGIDALFDVDEYIFTPELGGDLLARYQLAAVFDQQHEQLQRQTFQANRDATAAQLKATVIQLKIFEANFFLGHKLLRRSTGYLYHLTRALERFRCPT